MQDLTPTPSPVGDLESLAGHLAARRWKEADIETQEVMARTMGRRLGLTLDDVAAFPCERLQNIDDLWLRYSDGRFGFAVQRRIWIENEFDESRFGDAVGWRARGGWTNWIEVRFDENAPQGHLPVGNANGLMGLGVLMTLGRGLGGMWANGMEVYKYVIRSMISEGGAARLLDMLKADKAGSAICWMAGRPKLLQRLGACQRASARPSAASNGAVRT